MRRHLFMAGGLISLALGFIGAFLPVVPTVPFVILAAFCFSRGNERWHRWLREHPKLGPPLVDWENHGVIRKRAKIMATILISISWTSSMLMPWMKPSWKIVLSGILACVILFIWSRPSEPKNS